MLVLYIYYNVRETHAYYYSFPVCLVITQLIATKLYRRLHCLFVEIGRGSLMQQTKPYSSITGKGDCPPAPGVPFSKSTVSVPLIPLANGLRGRRTVLSFSTSLPRRWSPRTSRAALSQRISSVMKNTGLQHELREAKICQ